MMQDPYDIRILDASLVSFCRGKGGILQAVVASTAYSEIVLHRTFPFTYPDQYISLRTVDGEEVGILPDLGGLDEESKMEVETELRLRYLIPVVERVNQIKQNPAMWVFDMETNLGPIRMTMRNLHDHLQFNGPGRLIISDAEGRRCEVTDIDRLDAHSRKQLSAIL